MRLRLTFGLIVAVGAAILGGACGGSTAITEVSGPDAVRCQTALSAPPAAVPAAGNRVTLTVLAARECTWTASSDASWAQLSPSTGQGETPLTVTVTRNPEGRARTAVITVNGNRLSLMQQAAPCRFELSPDPIRLSHVGGRATTEVSTLVGCTWRASSNQPWVRVVTDNGTSSGTIALEVSRNDGPARSATLTVANHTATIEQDASAPAPPPIGPGPGPAPGPSPSPTPPPAPGPTPGPNPNPGTCVGVLQPDSRSFGSAASGSLFFVAVLPACSWRADPSVDWITLTGESGTRSGPGPVTYRVTANTSPNERTGVINVAGRTHTVRQAGAPSQARDVDFTGTAFNVSGSCPNLTFVVRGFSVFTDDDTKWKGGNCRSLKEGMEAKIEGLLSVAEGRVRARKVEVDDDDND